MKIQTPSLLLLALLGALTLPISAFASGMHAGSHAHQGADSAIGKPGVAANAKRSISVVMNDTMRFIPAQIQVKQGETVRFVVKNAGQLKHELTLDTDKELLEHLELMKKFPDMEHDEPNKLSLAPGKQGEIIWQFTKAGKVSFACLIPGHYEAGMRGAVTVSKK